jgi:hypothetical protein
MKRKGLQFLVLTWMLVGLPLLGIFLSGKPLCRYFELPPRTLYVGHAPFSWWALAGYALFVAAFITPFILRGLFGPRARALSSFQPRGFPLWGWAGIGAGIVTWILAWSRFSWFSPLQAHTFTPLWLAYIVTLNALTYGRGGEPLMLHRPIRFLLLFPLSALFWWFFEYLNRFVQNWQYVGVQFGPGEYCLYASLSFSTVLPAVMSTREWVLSFSFIQRKYVSFLPVRLPHPRIWGAFTLCFAAAGLAGLGIWPHALFSLLWISPLLIIVSLQAVMKEGNIFSPLAHGDWRGVLSSALAALICGFFWEMWNDYSLAKWTYHVPFVQRFEIFEMPILGYAGYLPFGLECAVISNMVLKKPEQESVGS